MGDFIKNILTPLSAVAAALLAAWVNFSVSDVQQKLKEQEVALTTLTTERNIKKLDEDLTFKVYEAVTTSLKSNDEKQQQAAAALLQFLAAEPLRTQLLQVFGASQTTAPEVREVVQKVLKEEQKFAQENAVLQQVAAKPAAAPSATRALPWNDWDVDIFWCERSGQSAQDSAAAIAKELAAQGAKGRIRARMLPDSVNAKPGYRVSGYAIRRDQNEAAQAEALKALVEGVVQSSQFEIVKSNQSTSWYLSAFVCP